MNSNSRESLNGAHRASVKVSVAGVTASDGNTHDFRAAVERPYSDRRRYRRKIHPIGRALRTAKKARGGKMSCDSCPFSCTRSSLSERFMLPRSCTVPGAFLLEKTQPRYLAKKASSLPPDCVFGSSIFRRWFQLMLQKVESIAFTGQPLYLRRS